MSGDTNKRGQALKASVTIAAIISFILSGAAFATNVACVYANSVPIFAQSFSGGDCIEYVGFGVDCLQIFGVASLAGEETGTARLSVSYDLVSFVCGWTLLFAIALVIVSAIRKVRQAIQ